MLPLSSSGQYANPSIHLPPFSVFAPLSLALQLPALSAWLAVCVCLSDGSCSAPLTRLGNRDVNLPHPQVKVPRGDEAVVAAVQPPHAQGRVLGRGGAAHGAAGVRLPDNHRVVVLPPERREVLPVKAARIDRPARVEQARAGWRSPEERAKSQAFMAHTCTDLQSFSDFSFCFGHKGVRAYTWSTTPAAPVQSQQFTRFISTAGYGQLPGCERYNVQPLGTAAGGLGGEKTPQPRTNRNNSRCCSCLSMLVRRLLYACTCTPKPELSLNHHHHLKSRDRTCPRCCFKR